MFLGEKKTIASRQNLPLIGKTGNFPENGKDCTR